MTPLPQQVTTNAVAAQPIAQQLVKAVRREAVRETPEWGREPSWVGPHYTLLNAANNAVSYTASALK